MDRIAGVGLAVYAALVASLLTPLYDPLSSGGDDDFWGVVAVVVLAHLGLGAAVGRTWVLVLPVAVSFVAFLLGGAEELAWLAIFLVMPVLVIVTAAGLLLRRFRWIAIACFAAAALPPLWAASETIRRGEPVPAALERQLPIEYSLGNLCPGAESDPELVRRLRRETDVLIRELERRPDDLVTYTYHDAHSADEDRREITIRELAQEQLADIESGGPNCVPDLERRIRAAL
jgi:hypothetical protein